MPRRLLPALAAALGLLASACGGSDGPGTRSTTTTSAPTCTPAAEPGKSTIAVTGTERTFVLHLPEDPAGPLPLIVLLHGHNSSGDQISETSDLPGQATEGGYAVAVPEGLGDPARWNFDGRPGGPDDGAFLAALLDRLESDACVDPDRVALVGSSNGAAFAGIAGCRAAAVVMVIATLPPPCTDAPPSVLTIRGTADRTVPFAGTPELVADLAADAGCDDESVVDAPHPGVGRTAFAGCRDGAVVVLEAIDGGVHTWPGGTDARRPDNSEAGRTFDATGAIVAFLDPILQPA